MQPQRPRRLPTAIVATVTLTVCSYLVVGGLEHFAISPEALIPEVHVPASFEVDYERPPPPAQVSRAILRRNIFDSRTGPLSWSPPTLPDLEAAPHDAEQGEASPAWAEPPRCAEKLRMVGSVIVANNPDRSLAVLEKDTQSKLLRVGDRFDEHTLLAVRPSFAYVQQGEDELCWVPLFLSAEERKKRTPPKAKKPAKATKPAKKKKNVKPAFSSEELAQGIVHSGGHNYRIARDFFERAMKDAASVARGVRMRPQQQDGRAVGVKVYGVRKDSVFHHLGIRSGDLLEAVNGHKLTNPAAMLELYGTLRHQDAFSLAITRGKTRITLSYAVQ